MLATVVVMQAALTQVIPGTDSSAVT